MTRQRIFSMHAKHDADVHLKILSTNEVGALFVAPEKNKVQVEI